MTQTSKNFAYVTILTTENYASGCLVLKQSLIDVSAKYPFYVVCPNDISDNVKQFLSKNDLQYILLENLSPDIIDRNNLSSYWNNTLFKIKVFDLVNFDKLVFLDTDMIVLQNLDHLFDYPHMSASDAGAVLYPEWKGGINSGLMVVEPDHNVYTGMLSCVDTAFEKRTKKNLGFGDQDIIKEFYPSWGNQQHLHLSEVYNTMLGYGGVLRKAKLINSWRDIKVYHYTGSQKPWNKSIRKQISVILKIIKRAGIYSAIDFRIYKHYIETLSKTRK